MSSALAPRPIWPNELLKLAGRLAGEGAGPGKPRTIDSRRSISTAYYAVFHELVIQATRDLVGTDRAVRKGGTNPATRWFSHTDIRKLAEAVARANPGHALSSVLAEPHDQLRMVAEAFVTLQAARERADYDHNFVVTRRDARYHLELARDAVGRARKLLKAEDPTYGRFLRLMVGAVGIAKNR